MINTGDRLRQIRQLRNMTQEDLADASGLTLSTVQRIENSGGGRHTTVLALAKALGVTVQELLEPCSDAEVSFFVFLDHALFLLLVFYPLLSSFQFHI